MSLCLHVYFRNAYGDGLLALQMNSPWHSLQYQVHFSFPPLPLLQISYTLSSFIAAQEYILYKVGYPVFTRLKGGKMHFFVAF